MKAFHLTSKVHLQNIKKMSLSTKIGLGKATLVDITSTFVANSINSIHLSSLIYDSSNILFFGSYTKSLQARPFNFISSFSMGNTGNATHLASRFKLKDFYTHTLFGRLAVQTVGSDLFRSKIKKDGLKQQLFKGFVELKELQDYRLKDKVSLMTENQTGFVSLRSSILIYKRETGVKKMSLNGITTPPNNFFYIAGDKGSIVSKEMNFSSNHFSSFDGISTLIGFFTQPTINLGGVVSSSIAIHVPLTISIGSSAFDIIHLHADIGRVNGVMSKSILFSIFREVIDFERIKDSAINIDVHASQENLSKRTMEIYIEAGDNLSFVSKSRYEKTIKMIKHEVRPNAFIVDSFEQKFLIDKRASKKLLSESIKDNAISIKLREQERKHNIPITILHQSIVVPIGTVKNSLISIPSVLIRGLSISFDLILGRIPFSFEMESLHAETNISNISILYGNAGVEHRICGSEMLPLWRIQRTSSGVFSWEHPVRIEPSFDGEVSTFEYILNPDGTINHREEVFHKRINILGGLNKSIFNLSIPERIDLLGVYSYMHVTLKSEAIINLSSSLYSFSVLIHPRVNKSGVYSSRIPFQTSVTENRDGIMSEEQPFATNMFINIEPILADINFRVDA